MTTDASISFATASWGDYWDKFGPEFVAAIQAMDPRPAEVVIVTDLDISLPAGMRHVRPKSQTPMWDWFNDAVASCSTEWIVCVGTDDLWLPDGLKDVALEGDAVQFAGLEDGQPWLPHEDEYRRFMDVAGNPMCGGTIFRRDVFLRYPWRRSVAADWLQWCDLFKVADVRFDLRPRFNHRRHDGAHSVATSPVKNESERHVRWMKQLLRTRDVMPGDDWPPKCGPLSIPDSGLRIELGGGSDAFRSGWLNVDLVDEADINHDLNIFPWPLKDESVVEVYSSHCLEHLGSPWRVFDEICRVCVEGAKFNFRVPHPMSDLAMCHSHEHVYSPLQAINVEKYFPRHFWHKPKRLKLLDIKYGSSIFLEEAKRDLPFLKRIPDEAIMKWIPRTCHECEFRYEVVRNEFI